MRSPATPPRHKLASALAVAILALALLPMLGGQPAAIAEEACGGAAAEGGSGVPLVADALAGKPTRLVNQVVALDGQAPVLGSFTVDGMTYAVTGEGAMELVAVAPAVLAGGLAAGLAGLPLPAPTAPPPEKAPAPGRRLRLRPLRRGNLPMAPRARRPPSPWPSRSPSPSSTTTSPTP